MTSIHPSAAVVPSDAERATLARVGAWFFRNRSVLPVPFVAASLAARGEMTPRAWAAGTIAIVLGEAIRLWGVAVAGSATRRRSRAVAQLVTHGPFAWTRNPLYAGNFFIWAGFACVSGVHWLAPVVAAAFSLEYGAIVRYEESVLESTFGDDYLRYKARTPRWIPVAFPRRIAGPLSWRDAVRGERSTLLQVAALALALAFKFRFA